MHRNDPQAFRNIYAMHCGMSVCLSVCIRHPGKMAEWIGMRLGMVFGVGLCIGVLDWLPVNSTHGHVVTRSTRHRSPRHRRDFFTKSTRHTVKSSHSHLVTSQHGTKLWVWAHAKFSGLADIKGHYQRAKFGCQGDSRG